MHSYSQDRLHILPRSRDVLSLRLRWKISLNGDGLVQSSSRLLLHPHSKVVKKKGEFCRKDRIETQRCGILQIKNSILMLNHEKILDRTILWLTYFCFWTEFFSTNFFICISMKKRQLVIIGERWFSPRPFHPLYTYYVGYEYLSYCELPCFFSIFASDYLPRLLAGWQQWWSNPVVQGCVWLTTLSGWFFSFYRRLNLIEQEGLLDLSGEYLARG